MTVGVINLESGQKKGTLLMKPINKGGFPIGVSEPAIFATIKMKKMIVCTLWIRQLLALINGRINKIAAPVVPNQLASIAPISRIKVFRRGFPTKSPFKFMPPVIVKSESSRKMNGKYCSNRTTTNA